MKFITLDAASAFAAIVDTMAIDPTSWRKWRVVHLSMDTQHADAITEQSYQYAMNEVAITLKNIDGMAYHCDDDNLFVLCRSITDSDLSELARGLTYTLLQHYEIKSEMDIYHPAENWRGVRDICVHHGYVSAFAEEHDDELEHNPLSLLVEDMEDIFLLNAAQSSTGMPTKILLVEDDPLARRIVSTCLKDSQHLITASNAQEAITNYMLHIPDIIFLDIGLPDHDGFSVIEAIKSHNPDAYIVMFSGKNYADYIARSLQMGASGFVEKPFRKENLFHYIDDYTEQRAM